MNNSITQIDLQALSQVGRVRDHNEDMLSLGGVLIRDAELRFPIIIDEKSQFHLLVSDGMGGHEQGERASQELLEYLSQCFKEERIKAESIEEDLRTEVKDFNHKLNNEALLEQQRLPMGCTLTGVVLSAGNLYVINAGDSRTYRFRNGILRQLTQDETVRALSGDPNDSKALLNCIGGGSQGNLTVENITDRILIGDILLICSDGLTDMVTDEAIGEILNESDDPLHELYDTACRNGGYDNISIILAKLD